MIRLARPEEATAISELIAASIVALCGADHHDDPVRIDPWVGSKSPEAVAEMLTDPEQRLFVTDAGGKILAVGAIDWRAQPRGQGRVTLLFVAPEARGQGHSRALLARMEAELHAMGRSEARLTATNTAVAFYRAQGWRAESGFGSALLGHALRKRLA